ncbi:Cell division protein FtsI [Peptidoglycan synthetase] [hydrothermal vent metagenome]|uniref:beta-lactamase n=1 Tax=hydrothermal vent metagenome TaxID=652676 RepID=A0A3B1DB19_9ZZZZ
MANSRTHTRTPTHTHTPTSTSTLSPRAIFRRRLMLLMAAFLLAGTAMAAQMVLLGVVRADASLAEAERRLYRQRSIPTVRGRILDRHSRVLAQNRPSYEVAIDYEVLSGQWAARKARRHAYRVHAKAWPLLTADQRDEVAARFLPLYQQHVAAMEHRLQLTLGIDAETYAERKATILGRVERTAKSVTDRRLERYEKEQIEQGRTITPEVRALLEERAAQPIAAQREPHVVGDLTDEAAFVLIRLQDSFGPIHAPGFDQAATDQPPDITDEVVPLLPGLVVRRSEERQYPYDRVKVTLSRDSLPTPLRDDTPLTLEIEGVAAHVIGWMGSRPLKSDTDRRAAQLAADPEFAERAMVNTLDRKNPLDRGRYLDGDPVARAGVEWSQEARLRGLRGLRTERLDTGERQRIDPQRGEDIRLTLDINLQARIQAILDPRFGLAQVHPYQGTDLALPVGTPLNGAAVVVDIDSGHVLALVTSPSFSRQTLRERPDEIIDDTLNNPLVNRAIAAPYPPGSIIKPLVLAGAVTLGVYPLGERIECTGHLLPGRPDILRCWIFRDRFGLTNHTIRFGHDLDGIDAITASCNIFFYTIGRRLGGTGIAQVLRDFGVGERWNLGVGAEFPGSIGGPKSNNDGADLTQFDATIMGMGQGPIAWTPLHAANAYATLARMGVAITPRVIDDSSPPEIHETSFDRRAIVAALEGLDGVINNAEQGTAHHITLETGREPIFNIPGIHYWGKTGTAQAPPLFLDNPPLDAEGNPIPIRAGDHAWVTILVGPEGDRPRFAISVIMEYGGSGGKVSGPIANQIVRALIDEGYLLP